MTVSRRLRFEILRRDDHACRYCGARAPDVKLAVDHVFPVALGGKDEPENLVTACVDCNAGKSATSPDEHIVANVEADALRWSSAMRAAAAIHAERRAEVDAYVKAFETAWDGWHYVGDEETTIPRPGDWRSSIERFHGLGVELDLLMFALDTAMRARTQRREHAVFKYMCGVVYKQLEQRTEIARQIIAAEEVGS